MNIVLLQSAFTLSEIDQLLHEFPQYLFLSFTEHTYKNLTDEDWERVEILYGSALTSEELDKASNLHWIHTPTPYLGKLCLEKIKTQENILISTTKEENVAQVGEFVLATVLSFGKQLFQWKEAAIHPHTIWDNHMRNTVWTLKDQLFLQVGLGTIGQEITRQMQQMGMRVWGVLKERTFQPFCDKVFPTKELHSVLPTADVVCLALPRGLPEKGWFGLHELELMKDDALLIIIGPYETLDVDALYKVAKSGKFRGIVIDAHYERPIPLNSKLWKIPNILITPEIAPRPKSTLEQSFRLFRYNLRQFLHGNFADMRNLMTHPLIGKPSTSENLNL